jgi:ABC-type Na+ efflux pump permease subunit
MINSMQTAVIKKDLRSITSNKRLFPVLIIVPLALTVILPSILILAISLAPEDLGDFQQLLNMLPISQQSDTLSRTIIGVILNGILPTFFTIVPIMAASVMAASSFVGEKEKRTLETLLYGPLSLKQIYQSKVLASFILSMLVSFISFFTMLAVVEIEILLTTGSILFPDISWLVTILLIAPAVSLLAVTLIVSGSAKAQTMEESQQRAIFLVLPLLLMIVGQFTGVIFINAWFLLGAGAILSVIAALFMKNSMRKFTYEMLLR